MSIVLMPALAEIIGPIVDPHPPSYFTMKSDKGTGGFAVLAITLKMAELVESVAYL